MESRALQPYFLFILIAGALVLSYFILAPFLAPLVLGIVAAVVLQPLYRRMLRWVRGRESLASLGTVIFVLIVLLVPLSLISVQLLREAQQLYQAVSGGGLVATIDNGIAAVSPTLDRFAPGTTETLANISSEIDAYAQLALSWIIQHLGAAFSSVVTVILDLFIFFVTLYYLLRDGGRLRQRLVEISPLSSTDDNAIFDDLGVAVNSVVKGMLSVALIQGTLSGIGFFIFGIPNAVLWGLVASVTALVPLLGTSVVLVPAVAYLALTGDVSAAIGLAVWGVVAVGLIDNFVGPRLMSSGMRLHPLLVLLSVLGGVALFGPVGVFVGPLALSFLLVLLSIHSMSQGPSSLNNDA